MINELETTGNSSVYRKSYWFVVIVYVILCTVLNRPTFEEFSGGIYLFGLILSLCMSIVEMKLAQFIGKSLALKRWKRAIVSFMVGLGMVLYLVSKQVDFGFGLIILLVFMVGILFSYGYAIDEEKFRIPRLIAFLTNKINTLKGSKVQLKNDLTRAQDQLVIKAQVIMNNKVESLNKSIASTSNRIEKLSKEKEAELKSVEHLEREVIAEIKRGYYDFDEVA
ncbi:MULTISPECIES: hypothetical protein [Roseivirga]|uniref:Uncharacterized protein n=1 Tax=Roseivirga spongicola TaxID=333140 RepID=A0A150XFL3_9BACT|nr:MULTISPECIES: hypothetical protein [Roseivirga]KYG77493.1 hypothetical protein AWW68_01615 [Roseivirga spongicola]MBO6762880.1 hypothetical protein [Roseivirga sp.]WPZ11202.1 hypothetical protein T7867_03690 [Roseivirga spongicola]